MALPLLADPAALALWSGRNKDDPKIVEALKSASTRFRSAVRHPVSLVANDEVWLDGTGTMLLLLPAAPVIGAPLVEVGGRAVADFTWSRIGVLHRLARWPNRLGCVRVIYSHGHAEVPDDVAEAVLHEARYLLAAEPAVSSMTVGGESVSFASAAAMPQVWRDAVANHTLRGDRP